MNLNFRTFGMINKDSANSAIASCPRDPNVVARYSKYTDNAASTAPPPATTCFPTIQVKTLPKTNVFFFLQVSYSSQIITPCIERGRIKIRRSIRYQDHQNWILRTYRCSQPTKAMKDGNNSNLSGQLIFIIRFQHNRFLFLFAPNLTARDKKTCLTTALI